jgi:hypothetical protein
MRMRLYHHTNHISVEVVLSRRNVLALLDKLGQPESTRTIGSEDCPEDMELVVRIEDDEDHYSGRGQPPGQLEPRTADFLDDRATEQPLAQSEFDLDDQDLPAGLLRPEPACFELSVLEQTEVWFDRFARLHHLREMPLEYLLNVIGWLERQAPRLYILARVDQGPLLEDQHFDDATEAEAEDDPEALIDKTVAWMRQKLLFRALSAEAEARLENRRP